MKKFKIRFAICLRGGRCPYSEGVASHSPGLPRLAATLGERSQLDLYPEGVAPFDNEDDATPLG